jgi:hypothetical protein
VQTPEPTTPPVAAATPDLAAALIESTNRQTELMERLAANQPKKRKTQADIVARRERKRFVHPIYQNGIEAQPYGLSDDTLKRCATLASGKYLNDVVEVVRTGKDENQRIHLFYDNTTVDKRMALKDSFASFSDMVLKITREMAARGIKPAA